MKILPLLLLALFLSSCLKTKKIPYIDCGIYFYLNEIEVHKDKAISITINEGWLDNTSLIGIFSIEKERFPSGHYLYAKYEEMDVYLSYIELPEKNNTQVSMGLVSKGSSMPWSFKDLATTDEIELSTPPESFSEVFLELNLKNDELRLLSSPLRADSTIISCR